MVRLLVADAHFIVRMGMKQLCLDLDGFSVAGEAENGAEALAALSASNFDMMVIDPDLPGRYATDSGAGGTNLINMIRVRHASLPILVFAGHNDPHTIKRVLSKGVSGFLSKNSDRETLVHAMRRVSVGENFISPDIAIKMMFESSKGRDVVLRDELTQREWQVLNLIGKGWNLNAIAEELGISSRTVSTYKARMMHKMNFKNNAELFHFAHEFGKADSKRHGEKGDVAGRGEDHGAPG